MSFAGHVMDMINRQRFNEAQKNRRKERRQKLDGGGSFKADGLYAIEKKQLSAEELSSIKSKYKQEKAKRLKKELILFIVIVILLTAALAYIWTNFFA